MRVRHCLLLLTLFGALMIARADDAAWQAHMAAARKCATITYGSVEGDWWGAARHYYAAMKEAERLGPNDPRLAESLDQLALLYMHTSGEMGFELDANDGALLNRCEWYLLRAKDIRVAAYGRGDPHVAISVCMLAHVATHPPILNDTRAIRTYQRALAMVKDADPRHAVTVAEVLDLVAQYYADEDLGQYVQLKRQALDVYEKAYGAEDPRIVPRLYTLAACMIENPDDAEALYRRALTIVEKAYGAEDPRLLDALCTLASFYEATERAADAETLRARALANAERAFGTEDLRLLPTLQRLVTSYTPCSLMPEDMEAAMGMWDEGEDQDAFSSSDKVPTLLTRATRIADQAKDAAAQSEAWGRLAAFYRQQQRAEDAWRPLERALAAAETAYGTDDPRILPALSALAEWAIQEDPEAAAPLYTRAIALAERHTAARLKVVDALERAADGYMQAGERSKSTVMRAKMADLMEADPDANPEAVVNALLRWGMETQVSLSDDHAPIRRALAYVEKTHGATSLAMASLLRQLMTNSFTYGPPADQKVLKGYVQRLEALLPRLYPVSSEGYASALLELGAHWTQVGESERAFAATRKAHAILKVLPGHSASTMCQATFALANCYGARGDWATAIPLYEQLRTSNVYNRLDYADTSDIMLLVAYRAARQYEKADAVYARMLHRMGSQREDGDLWKASTWTQRATMWREGGHPARAERCLREAEALLAKSLQSKEQYQRYAARQQQIGLCTEQAQVYLALRQPAQARASETKMIYLSFADSQGHGVSTLAAAYRAAGQQARAVALLQRALVIAEKYVKPQNTLIRTFLVELGESHARLHHDALAEQAFTRALALEEQYGVAHAGHPFYGMQTDVMTRVIQFYQDRQRHADAERLLRKAYARSRKQYENYLDAYLPTITGLAKTLIAQRKYAEAEQLLVSALREARALQEDHGKVAPTTLALTLGKLYLACRKPTQAAPLLKEAFDFAELRYSDVMEFKQWEPYATAHLQALGALGRTGEMRTLQARIATQRATYQRLTKNMTNRSPYEGHFGGGYRARHGGPPMGAPPPAPGGW